MNPHNQLLHAVYQQAKWRIIEGRNNFVCCAIKDAVDDLVLEIYESTILKNTSLQNFQLFFKHLDLGYMNLYWPPYDKLSRVKALDAMITLCKKNQL